MYGYTTPKNWNPPPTPTAPDPRRRLFDASLGASPDLKTASVRPKFAFGPTATPLFHTTPRGTTPRGTIPRTPIPLTPKRNIHFSPNPSYIPPRGTTPRGTIPRTPIPLTPKRNIHFSPNPSYIPPPTTRPPTPSNDDAAFIRVPDANGDIEFLPITPPTARPPPPSYDDAVFYDDDANGDIDFLTKSPSKSPATKYTWVDLHDGTGNKVMVPKSLPKPGVDFTSWFKPYPTREVEARLVFNDWDVYGTTGFLNED